MHYLLGHKFVIKTDQKSLRSLTDQNIHTPKNWIHKLMHDFTIEYKSGKDNLADEALSRSFLMAISHPQFQLLSQLKSVVAQDTHLSEILHLCLQNKPPHQNYTVSDGLLLWKGHLVIPNQHSLV